MLKFGQFVCKHKKTILIIALILLIPSILGMKATRTNYDILAYLPDNIETIQGQNILKDDFNMGAFSVIILSVWCEPWRLMWLTASLTSSTSLAETMRARYSLNSFSSIVESVELNMVVDAK